jgi:hypothetical protein
MSIEIGAQEHLNKRKRTDELNHAKFVKSMTINAL